MIAYVIYDKEKRIEFGYDALTNGMRIQYNDEDYFYIDHKEFLHLCELIKELPLNTKTSNHGKIN